MNLQVRELMSLQIDELPCSGIVGFSRVCQLESWFVPHFADGEESVFMLAQQRQQAPLNLWKY